MKIRAPGYDNFSAWIFKKYIELADVVAQLLSLPFASRHVYTNWKIRLCLKLPVQLLSVIFDPSLLHLLFHELLRKSLLRDGCTLPFYPAPLRTSLPFDQPEVQPVLLSICSIMLVACLKPIALFV